MFGSKLPATCNNAIKNYELLNHESVTRANDPLLIFHGFAVKSNLTLLSRLILPREKRVAHVYFPYFWSNYCKIIWNWSATPSWIRALGNFVWLRSSHGVLAWCALKALYSVISNIINFVSNCESKRKTVRASSAFPLSVDFYLWKFHEKSLLLFSCPEKSGNSLGDWCHKKQKYPGFVRKRKFKEFHRWSVLWTTKFLCFAPWSYNFADQRGLSFKDWGQKLQQILIAKIIMFFSEVNVKENGQNLEFASEDVSAEVETFL